MTLRSERPRLAPAALWRGALLLSALLVAAPVFAATAGPAAPAPAAANPAKPRPEKPDPVTTVPLMKCVQRGLAKAGYSPRGIDGILGPRTAGAATSWRRKAKRTLPALTAETAPRWCAALLVSTGALPKPTEGSERYCSWFPETLNGVWLYPDGTPALRFRLGSQADGGGCYAWLNAVPAWYIDGAGTQFLRVTREGPLRETGDDKNGMILDVKTGLARSLRGGYTTTGVLITP